MKRLIVILDRTGQLGLLGSTCLQSMAVVRLIIVSYGLIAREIERIDSGYRRNECPVFLVSHRFIVMAAKNKKVNYLPKLLSGEWVGCFGLTEPNSGSDPASMSTRAEKLKEVPSNRQ
jgi:glutaryl-CoA dehydrogenase